MRTLLYRLRINGPSLSLDDLSVFADYVRFLLVPSQVSCGVIMDGTCNKVHALLRKTF